MTRISAKTMNILAATVLLGGAVAGVNCSKSSTTGTGNGLVRLALKTASGLTINSVNYEIDKSDGSSFAPPIAGVINTSDKSATPSIDVSVPASTGDIVKLTATATDGATPPNSIPCTGQATMQMPIVAGQQTQVNVNLICGGSQVSTGSGSAVVLGQVVQGDNCPVLQTWMASPLAATTPTGTVSLAGMATDADVGEKLTYTWSAPQGSFNPASSANVTPGAPGVTSTYTCTTAGDFMITLTVTDNHLMTDPNSANCPVSVVFYPIHCANGVYCGNGVVDQPSEVCDDGTLNGHDGLCDANCQPVTPVCGDGFVQPAAGETCDDGPNNGKDGICDSMCHAQAAVCGDNIVETGEQCDPSNWNTTTNTGTCNTSQCCVNCKFQSFDQTPVCQACESKVYTTGPQKFSCVKSLYSNATGFGCNSFASAADKLACNNLRTCILTQKCSNGNDPTPCYCGARDATTCAGPMGPDGTGKCLAQYNAVALPAGKVVSDMFTDASSPIGVANNLLTCDVDATCACGQ
jgi:hypothetical protein